MTTRENELEEQLPLYMSEPRGSVTGSLASWWTDRNPYMTMEIQQNIAEQSRRMIESQNRIDQAIAVSKARAYRDVSAGLALLMGPYAGDANRAWIDAAGLDFYGDTRAPGKAAGTGLPAMNRIDPAGLVAQAGGMIQTGRNVAELAMGRPLGITANSRSDWDDYRDEVTTALTQQEALWGETYPDEPWPGFDRRSAMPRGGSTMLEGGSATPGGMGGSVQRGGATRDPWLGRSRAELQQRQLVAQSRQRAIDASGGYTRLNVNELGANRPPELAEGAIPTTEHLTHQRYLEAAVAGHAMGIQVFRDSRGDVRFFDDVTNRFFATEDLDRALIGGFDLSYRVNQRNRIGAGNMTDEPGYMASADRWAAQGIRTPYATPYQLSQEAARRPSREQVWTGARYYEGDEWATFAGMRIDDKVRVQERLVAAGYLDPDKMRVGVWDFATAQATQYLMTEANGNGLTWPEMLMEAEQSMAEYGRGRDPGGGGTRISPFVAPTYIAPDYDTLKQGVRRAFDSILGRNVMDHELKLLADSMGSDYRLAYEAEVSAARDEYDRMASAIRSGASIAAPGGTVQGVNPLDTMSERMLERYAPEVERTEEIGERAYNGQLVMQALGVMERSVGR